MSQTGNRKHPKPDLTLLKEMTEGNNEVLLEIINLFIEDAPEMLDNVVKSANAKDLQSLAFSSHKIKSDLSIVGLPHAAAIMKQIERSAIEGKIEEEQIPVVKEMIEIGIEDLKKMV